jgi:hypothetical protein
MLDELLKPETRDNIFPLSEPRLNTVFETGHIYGASTDTTEILLVTKTKCSIQ